MKFQELLEKFLIISFEIRFLYLPLSAVGTALEQSDSQFRFRFNGSYCNTLEQVSTFKTDEHYSTRLPVSSSPQHVGWFHITMSDFQLCNFALKSPSFHIETSCWKWNRFGSIKTILGLMGELSWD